MITTVLGRAIGVILLATLLERWQLLAIVASPDPTSALARFIAVVWIVLVVFSATGLLIRRPWAPYVLIVLAVVSTVFHGIALVPGITRITSMALRPTIVAIVNGIIVLAGLALIRAFRTPSREIAGIDHR